MAELKLNPMSDVAKPGTTPATPTTRPLVVGNSNEVSDPMVAPEKPAEKPTVQTVSGVPLAAQPDLEPAKTGEIAGTGSMVSKLTPTTSSAEIIKDVADDSDKALADKKNEKSEKDVNDEQQARLAELIESGDYNVSVGQEKGTKGAATFILTVLAILLVGAVTIFLLSDLKIIDLGLKLPFHLFKQ